MDYIILIGALLCSSTASIFAGFFNRACEGKKSPTQMYNLFLLATVFIGWLIYFFVDMSFDAGVIPYAVGFGIAYCTSMFGIINAIRTGPVLITTLIQQFSLIATTVWGFLFWGDELDTLVIIGLVTIILALFLCLYTGKSKEDEKKFSPIWLLYVAMAFFGNAGCTIIQKSQQIAFAGQHRGMLMATAMLFGFALFVVLYLRSDRADSKFIAKKAYFPVLAGVANLFLNLFVMILATSALPSSLVYPTISIGSLMIVILFSLFAFHEKLLRSQWVGIALGIISVLLLSL